MSYALLTLSIAFISLSIWTFCAMDDPKVQQQDFRRGIQWVTWLVGAALAVTVCVAFVQGNLSI